MYDENWEKGGRPENIPTGSFGQEEWSGYRCLKNIQFYLCPFPLRNKSPEPLGKNSKLFYPDDTNEGLQWGKEQAKWRKCPSTPENVAETFPGPKPQFLTVREGHNLRLGVTKPAWGGANQEKREHFYPKKLQWQHVGTGNSSLLLEEGARVWRVFRQVLSMVQF